MFKMIKMSQHESTWKYSPGRQYLLRGEMLYGCVSSPSRTWSEFAWPSWPAWTPSSRAGDSSPAWQPLWCRSSPSSTHWSLPRTGQPDWFVRWAVGRGAGNRLATPGESSPWDWARCIRYWLDLPGQGFSHIERVRSTRSRPIGEYRTWNLKVWWSFLSKSKNCKKIISLKEKFVSLKFLLVILILRF